MTPFRLMFGVDARSRDDPRIRELLDEELVTFFSNEREELRSQAKESIQHVQTENKRRFDKSRKKAFQYREGDLVAICRTQYKPGSKLAHKFLGPYEVTKTLRHDRYVVRRIGESEGPKQTSSAVDFMKPWTSDDGEDQFRSDEEDESGGHSGRTLGQDGRV
ncbi:hypothetical protein X777_06695 [Ooceraea biroi]|uniref:Uncharacterized protein n=1 Tax=Ooceraea biroi TaxID=2015173 RepID=A0A026WD09_OOCBI|nr:hypothetical protein X777_06695 [Ooceraea biroi]